MVGLRVPCAVEGRSLIGGKEFVNNRTALMLVAVLFVGGACISAELRIVNGKEVDLQPLIDWEAHKKGERPLKHWKRVQIVENKRQTGYTIVMADIEGTKTQIALKNYPDAILQLLTQKQTLEGQLT